LLFGVFVFVLVVDRVVVVVVLGVATVTTTNIFILREMVVGIVLAVTVVAVYCD